MKFKFEIGDVVTSPNIEGAKKITKRKTVTENTTAIRNRQVNLYWLEGYVYPEGSSWAGRPAFDFESNLKKVEQ